MFLTSNKTHTGLLFKSGFTCVCRVLLSITDILIRQEKKETKTTTKTHKMTKRRLKMTSGWQKKRESSLLLSHFPLLWSWGSLCRRGSLWSHNHNSLNKYSRYKCWLSSHLLCITFDVPLVLLSSRFTLLFMQDVQIGRRLRFHLEVRTDSV